MNKEELQKKLRQEAEENCVCTDFSMRKMFEIGYIAGAEPREKRIAELEKENAELKEALKGKVCNCMTYLNFKDLEKKCAKAKVFIRNLKNLIEDVCDINYLSKDNTRLLVEAEQFISEVEE